MTPFPHTRIYPWHPASVLAQEFCAAVRPYTHATALHLTIAPRAVAVGRDTALRMAEQRFQYEIAALLRAAGAR